MKLRIPFLTSTVLATIALLSTPAPAQTSISQSSEQQTLGAGVIYKHIATTTPAGEPWSIHVLEIARNQPGVAVRAASGRGAEHSSEMQRELPTQIAERSIASGENVLAVINGDYDAMPYLGVSVGPSVTSGRLWTAGGKSTWPAFAILKDGGAVIGSPHFSAELRVRGRSWRISTFNKSPALTPGLVLYTRDFRPNLKAGRPFRAITLASIQPGLPLKVDSSITAVVKDNVPAVSEIAIPDNALVLVAPDASGAGVQALTLLKQGQKVQLKFALDVDGKSKVLEAIGGWPIVVHNGRREIIGNPAESHSKRHPRTAVCYNEKSVIFAVVDGRQPKLSVGMTLNELGDLMVSLGCEEAINTDGGGSSIMAILDGKGKRLKIVNSPSDGKERGRGNALLVESKATTVQ